MKLRLRGGLATAACFAAALICLIPLGSRGVVGAAAAYATGWRDSKEER